MKRTGKLLTVTAAVLGIVLAAPIIVKAVKGKQEDEAKKEPVRQAVVLLDAAKSPEQLGVENVQLNIDGSGGMMILKEGRIKFAAGCGAEKFVANVEGLGSVPLEFETQTVYTETDKFELYRLKTTNLVPATCFAGTAKLKIDIYACVGARIYKIKSVEAEVAGLFDTIWKTEDPWQATRENTLAE